MINMGVDARKAEVRLNKGVVLSLVFWLLIGFCVSRVKYEVVFFRNKLKEIEQQIEKYQDDIRVYGAEWSYLNDPKRLKRLATKHLPNLRPTETKQIMSLDAFMASDFEKEFGRTIASSIERNSKIDITEQSARKAFSSFLDEAVRKHGGSMKK